MIALKKSTLKQKQKNTSRSSFWLFFSFALISIGTVEAQVQNNGSLYIHDAGSFFVKSGNFAFGTGSSTNTSRTTSTFGKLIFDASATSSGAASGATLFTDGFASTTGTSFFVLPTGQTSTYAPVGITNATVTNGVNAAFYLAAPSTIGATLASSVTALQAAGYWQINGDNATITMIWSSDISSLSTSIANLTVAGYNPTTSKWEAITSATPTGSLTSGTIATSAAVTLANYSAFTLAKRGIICAPVFAATGTTKTWNAGWSPSAPTEIDPAIISGAGSPGSFVCNSLAVNANISLADGQTIEVVNAITGTGVITMSNEASVMQRNDASTISPTITLTKRTRSGLYPLDYTYFGSPLTADSFSQLANAQAFNNANSASSGVIGAFDLKYKYVSGDATTAGGWQTLTATSPGSGFIMRIKPQAPFATALTQNTTDRVNIVFSGATNNGALSVNIANILATPTSARNNNLLANPYPSAIDSDKFLEYNTNLDGVVYIWKAQTNNSGLAGAAYSAGDYIAYTRAGSTADGSIGATAFNGKIATGQGFKVKAITATGTGTATFNNCMRVSGNNNQFNKASNDATKDRYKLNMVGANGTGNQILVAYMPEATQDYDRMYDAEMNSVSAAQVCSFLDNTTTQLAINARPAFDISDTVKIGISKADTTTENFTIAMAENEGVFNTGAVLVYLHDTVLHIYHNFANGAYSFNSNTTEMNNRFQVVYQDAALNNIDFESNNVVAAINKQNLNIVASLPISTVAIYDISGRLVTAFDGNNQTSALQAFHFAEGIYIAKIKMNNGATATRKLINKN
jgi:hypothetical protein